MKPKTTEIKSDLLIVGGGIAGINAAMAAREQDVQVTILDKAGIARSGNLGAGVDHFTAYLEQGEPWDTRAAWLEHVSRTLKGGVDIKVHEAIFCNEIKAAMERMARIGNRLDDPKTGKFVRTGAFGQPGPLTINFNGKKFKPNLAREARRIGCQIIEKAMGTKIFTSDGRAVGAMAFHVRNGQFYIIQAKAVVAATGIATRQFENPSGFPFNTWQSPYNTGDAQAMAFRAGAELANMEYLELTVVPKGFSAAGLGAFIGMGCYLVNAAGERFMTRYHPQGERALRYKIIEGVMTETSGGRGPVYIDARHLDPIDIEHLKTTLSWDKDTFPEYLAQKGLDISRDLMEVMVSEGMQRGPGCLSSGIRISERCSSSLAGLYAAGDSTDQVHALSPSTTSGYVAGREAAKWAKQVKSFETLDEVAVKKEQERILAPLRKKNGITYSEFEDVIRKIMWQQVGPARTEASLKIGLTKLAKLKQIEEELTAREFHQAMRAAEAQNLLTVSQIMAEAALFRKESRFGLSHYRADYPESDDKNWQGLVVVRKEDEGIKLSFKPLSY